MKWQQWPFATTTHVNGSQRERVGEVGGGGGNIKRKMEIIETNFFPKEDIGSCIVCNGSIGIDTEIVLLFTSYVEFA